MTHLSLPSVTARWYSRSSYFIKRISPSSTDRKPLVNRDVHVTFCLLELYLHRLLAESCVFSQETQEGILSCNFTQESGVPSLTARPARGPSGDQPALRIRPHQKRSYETPAPFSPHVTEGLVRSPYTSSAFSSIFLILSTFLPSTSRESCKTRWRLATQGRKPCPRSRKRHHVAAGGVASADLYLHVNAYVQRLQ